MRARAGLAASMAALAVFCGTLGHGEGTEDRTLAQVRNAPLTVAIEGRPATLEAHLWVNLLPGPQVRSNSSVARIAAKLRVPDGVFPVNIAIARLWLVFPTGEPVQATLSPQPQSEGVRALATATLPQHPPAKVWVVAEIKSDAGGLFIRTTETTLQIAR